MRLAPRFAEPRLGGLKSLFSWWENIGLQARFMVIASVGLLTLAIGALAVVDWYEFSSFEEKLKAFSENELRSLNSLVESAMERRPGDQQNVAVKVFNGWFESRNKEYAGKLWSVWGPKTKAYMAGTAPERAPKMPLDAIDEATLRTGQPLGRRQTLALVASINSLALTNAKFVDEAALRGRIEEQFRQSQKMETLGQL